MCIRDRGIHVDGVDCVVQFDPPEDNKAYTHRAGRTARAGASGVVVSFVTSEQLKDTKKLQRQIKVPCEFEEPTPESKLDLGDPIVQPGKGGGGKNGGGKGRGGSRSKQGGGGKSRNRSRSGKGGQGSGRSGNSGSRSKNSKQGGPKKQGGQKKNGQKQGGQSRGKAQGGGKTQGSRQQSRNKNRSRA